MSKGGQQQTYGLPQMSSMTSNESTYIPSWLTSASQQGVNAAGKLLANPGQAYTGEISPGMTADQQAAGQMFRNNVGSYQPWFNQARDMTQAGTQQGPQIAAETFRNGLSGISAYMNPFTSQVVDNVSAMGRRNLDAALTNEADSAIRARAFGGSRQGVREGAAIAENNLNTSNQIAQLLSQGYDRATALMGSDISNNMQAQGANQSAYQNYMNRLQGAGSQLANIGSAARQAQVGDVNNLFTYGQSAQQTKAAQDQARYQEFLRMQGLPYQALQSYGQMLGVAPHDTTGTKTTSGWNMTPQQQQSSSPLMGGLGGALAGAQMGGMFGPWGAGIGAIGGGLLGAFR